MTHYTKKILLAVLLAVVGLTLPKFANAAESTDSIHTKLYWKMLDLYSGNSTREEFYEAAEELLKYYRENGMLLEYYKTQVNICLYDTEKNRSVDALKRANDILEEMKEEEFDAYSQVYLALGTIFESRGNYRMAHHYYEDAINSLPSSDIDNLMSAYSRIAYLAMFRDPVEADYWNKKYIEESLTFPAYHQVALFIDGMINFTVGNKRGFQSSYQAYQKYHHSNPNLDNYGSNGLMVANLAMEGNYEKALDTLNHIGTYDLSAIAKYDMRVIIYKMMNRYDKALEVEQRKADYADSLYSDILFNNMNKLNAQLGLAQAESKATSARETLFIMMLIMAIVLIGLMTLWLVRNKKNKRELLLKNEQLNTALAMAEESERMKSEFVRSVSHEIRTPLNAINGFNDLLNTPGITLQEGERREVLARIYDNTKAITNIVDEMLRVADKESNEYAAKDDKLFVNNFFSGILYSYREKSHSSVELLYTTRLINRQQIMTNEEGVRKIVEHLIQNAIKFTRKGSIELHCELSEDNTMLLVSVSDTGPGIKPEAQQKIFEGFYKTDAFQQGIGLGLAVSKKIANKLDGDLTIDSTYTKGARFVLSLPAV